jgi:hypothetical protein
MLKCRSPSRPLMLSLFDATQFTLVSNFGRVHGVGAVA